MKKNLFASLSVLVGIVLFVFINYCINARLQNKDASDEEYIALCDEATPNYVLINDVYNQLAFSSKKNISKPCKKTLVKKKIVTESTLSYPILENKMPTYLNKEIYEVTFEHEHLEDGLILYVDENSHEIIGILGGRD